MDIFIENCILKVLGYIEQPTGIFERTWFAETVIIYNCKKFAVYHFRK